MFLLFLLVLIFVIVRLFTSIWLQIWLDDGDGHVDERLANATAMDVTITDQELRGDIGANPKLWIYQMIYGLSLIVLVLVALCKGFAMALSLMKGSSRFVFAI
jgi:hypothetical protein